MSTSSTASASSPKVSMFGAKTGFVIPKNKLSGSLVPIFRGGGKVEGSSSVKEEAPKKVQRKTKWGGDLTQDAAVIKGRAVAYQTRLEQITEQLKSGALEIVEGQDSQSPKQAGLTDEDHEGSLQRIQSQKIEALNLERREIIGEIVLLNPSYKTPIDYKPLLKEAKVPVPPNKAYTGCNFIGLLLGNKKRLEEETGAKVSVQGTKVGTAEKREITLSSINDAQGVQDLCVHVSAETYEKVDAAVALIELLLTPVSGSSAVASTDSSSVAGDVTKQLAPVFVTQPMTTASQGMLQQSFMPSQAGPTQFNPYVAPWFQTAPPSSPHPPSGYMPMHSPNNIVRFPPSPVGPGSAPPYFGQPPFGSAPRTQSPPANRPQFPGQGMQMQQPPNHGITYQNHPMPGQQQAPVYSVMRPQHNSSVPLFTAQPVPASLPASGPPLMVNPGSVPVGTVSNMQPRAPGPHGNSSGWSNAPISPNNVTPMAPPPVNTHARMPQPVFSNNMTGRPPVANFAPPAAFSFQPSTAPPNFSSAPPMVSASSGPLLSAPIAVPAAAPVPQRPTFSSPPVPLPVASPVPQSPHAPAVAGSSSGTLPSFSHVASATIAPVVPMPSPTITAPKPLRPSSGDFTFQPLRTQVPASPTTPGASSPAVQNMSQVPPVAPQVPSFRPAAQNSAPAPHMGTHGWPQAPVRPPPSTAPAPAPFSLNSTSMQPPPGLLFPNQRPMPSIAPTTQMGPPSFSPAPQALNSPATQMGRPLFSPAPQMGRPVFPPAPQSPHSPGSFMSQPFNPMQPYQNQLPRASRPISITPLNQQFQNQFSPLAARPSSSSGANQYDPFSPTSVSQGGESVKARKPETDAEYEDLMASVGVK